MTNRSFPGAHHILVLCLVLGVAGAGVAAEPKAKPRAADAEAKGKPERKKPAVRIIVLKGAYKDHPLTPAMDPFSLLSGDLDKPNSFFSLCEKIDELAEDDEIQHVLFDLSAPDFRMDLAQLSELSRHIRKL